MAQDSSSMSTPGGSQGSPASNTNNDIAKNCMMKYEANIQTMAHNYGMSKYVEKGK
jgi:hypothetical protein